MATTNPKESEQETAWQARILAEPNYDGRSSDDFDAGWLAARRLAHEIFDALDGKDISYLVGHYRNSDREYRIGGIISFMSEQWSRAPLHAGEPWESLTLEQRLESARFSAQHALIKKLGELRGKLEEADRG